MISISSQRNHLKSQPVSNLWFFLINNWKLLLISHLQCESVEQVGLCFYLIRGFLSSLEEMVIIGVKRRMEEVLEKHMKGLRCYFKAFKSQYSFLYCLNSLAHTITIHLFVWLSSFSLKYMIIDPIHSIRY
jgi:hypothetical protein